ncbi:MAG TPA: methyltransferase domain-containing protein [Microthrixaceae bacterium]|nr:methyltransferase domain-containing protein [Microthrixaceae bacterium]
MGDPAGRVVFFGSYDKSLHPRVAVLREGLSGLGHDVVEVNVPLGLSTADKVDAASSAGGALRLLRAILSAWIPLWRQGRKVATPDLVVVGYLGHFDVHLARLIWPKAQIALDHMVGLADTARDRGVATGLKYRLLDGLDRAAFRKADLVLVDTAEQKEQLPADVAERSVVVPVGATQSWFEQGHPPASLPLKVCFVGLYTPLQGATVIGRAIARLADDPRIEFTMVGSGQDLDETVAVAAGGNVKWINWVDSSDLPQLVASQHICLGIFGTSPKAQRVVPNKVYQGLAAGNLVITSDTEVQRRALGGVALYVPPGDDEALAESLARVADDPEHFGVGASEGRVRAETFLPERVVVPLDDQIDYRKDRMTSRTDMAPGPALPPNAWLRFDILRGPLEDLPPSRVLEIGPGRGAVAARIVSAGHDYTGVEMSDDARETTAELLGSIPGGRSRLLSSVDELGDEDLFDLVCAFEVLEHIEDDSAALREWVAHLAPGGLLLLSVPAWPDRFSTHDVEVGHIRRYAPQDLAAMASTLGLVEVEPRLYGFPLGFGLEWIRNTMSKRSQKGADIESESAIDRTKRSSGWFQPPRSANTIIQVGTWPFRVAQRRVSGKGTGLVLIARKPGE